MSRIKKLEMKRIANPYLLAGVTIYLFYILGAVFPDTFWSVHFIAFLPTPLKAVFIILPPILMFPFISNKIFIYFGLIGKIFDKKINLLIIAILLSSTAGALFYSYPIQTDLYGDARYLSKEGAALNTGVFSSDWIENVFSPDIFTTKNQDMFNRSFVQIIAYFANSDIIRAFRILNAACGFLYVFIFIIFAGTYFVNNQLKILMILTGLLTGFVQLFFGHTELYASSMLFVSAYLMAVLLFFQKHSIKWLIISAFVLALSMKAHSAGLLLLPGFLLVLAYRFAPKLKPFLVWKNISFFLLLPIIIIGLILYFFILKNYDIPYAFPKELINQYIFLPIIPSPPPLDGYTMFSYNHIFDYFSEFFFWPLVSFLIIIVVLIKHKRETDWNNAGILISGISLILYVSLFFAVNPLLSMPRDWDLFSLPAPILLFFSIAIVKLLENNSGFIKNISGIIPALSLLVLPMFIVNSDKDLVSRRMESMGVHIYNSYWVNSGYVINAAMQTEKDKMQYLYRYCNLFQKIEPKYKGKNYEYSLLATKIGNFYSENSQPENALKYYKLADEYYSGDKIITLNLGTTNYLLENYSEALKFAERLVGMDSANADYLMLAINSSYRLKIFDKALKYSEMYLKIKPGDEIILQLIKKLKI